MNWYRYRCSIDFPLTSKQHEVNNRQPNLKRIARKRKRERMLQERTKKTSAILNIEREQTADVFEDARLFTTEQSKRNDIERT